MLYLKKFADLITYNFLFIQNAVIPLKVMAGEAGFGQNAESVPPFKFLDN